MNKNVYVGLRYIPKIIGEWNKLKNYESLSIVTYQGSSYTSKTNVPIGVEITNEEYWLCTGNYNAQLEVYKSTVDNIKKDYENKLNISDIVDDINGNGKILSINKNKEMYSYIKDWGINVKIFGAIGDGINDDTNAIQNAINYFGQNGGKIYIPNGIYRITQKINLINANISSNKTLCIEGEDEKNVIIKLDNNNSDGCFIYDNGGKNGSFGVEYHFLNLKNLTLTNTHNNIKFESWHKGVGLNIIGACNSKFENITIIGFLTGLYCYGGWINSYKNIKIESCLNGILLNYATFHSEIIKPITNNCGSGNVVGSSIHLVNTGGISIVGLMLENSKQGLIIENVNGLSITGGNVETIEYSYSINIMGLKNSDLQNKDNWSTGVSITGVRFYNTLGIVFQSGVDSVNISGNTFVKSGNYDINNQSCIASSGDNKLIQNVNYSNNYFNLNGLPNVHYNDVYPDYKLQSFTFEGKRYSTSDPNNYVSNNVRTFKKGEVIYNKTLEELGTDNKYIIEKWICVEEGKPGKWKPVKINI